MALFHEGLFHYYVWGFLKLFGFNILSYQAALFVIYSDGFVLTLLLVDLFWVLHCHICHGSAIQLSHVRLHIYICQAIVIP
jgi:hypothetical protein